MSRSTSKIRDIKSSGQKEIASIKNRRSVSADTRARGSYVPDRKGQRSSSDERKSGNSGCNRWSGARKSSINLLDGNTKRKDVRPLTDKAYQKKKASDLVEFLQENDFKYPITTSKLQSPSKKDFENIFQFLYNFFDPVYQVKKIEEEAPKILKNLSYPFTVNKSAFVYVARTNWPSLLGVLIWLMDSCKFAKKVDMNNCFERCGDGEKAEIHRIALRYICQCYYSGNDNEDEENMVFRQIVKSSMAQNLDELLEQNNEKKELEQSLEKELQEMKALAEQKAELNANIVKYEDYIGKMESHSQKKNEELEQLRDKAKEKELELKEQQEKVSHKQDAYDAQGFDGKKQLNYFDTQKKELTEKLRIKSAMFKDLQDKCWELEIQYTKNSDKVDAVAFKELYNTTVDKSRSVLQVLQSTTHPHIQKLCNSYNLDFPICEIPPNKDLANWSKTFNSSLERVLAQIKSTIELFNRVSTSQHQKISEVQMESSEYLAKCKLLSVQETQKEGEMNLIEKQAVDGITSLEVQCDKIHEVVKVLHNERSKLETIWKEMSDELASLEAFREEKDTELKNYLAEQSEIFQFFLRSEQEAEENCLGYGNEIAMKLKQLSTN